ncbi:protein phosphatase 2C domain-containing protein [Gilvimarinus agarilyticus]|uniref:PP2C family protein-serine/threonine phosphatase n=1 Tax=unclassified Gilvimarinus TaxID=2642066 RepID=UPI001C08A430|nr:MULTISPECIES: protein phosphatase 2C domain-containing protein [unclassified Gilvimarinus]MBU2887016.1 protein phosphatase 2C domain-containing protein [Gilvimarinus agarilyticus]MDO6571676.1 protein phosphatase 2C domain-containing protein [Gilvimarinus sp. 2_MG-2023]MDO6745748.1 protein phosphatase 2C domain-containing protein [Gilvimarinus sp. 1_MG-2023]
MQGLESSSLTNPGRKRSNNEDCYLSLPEQNLWMVADGMGGHEAGEVASDIVRRTLKEQTTSSLQTAIQNAHKAVLSAAAKGIGAEGMGSTVVAMKHWGDHYEIAWVGDSRAYLYTPGQDLEALTTDHSYVQMLLESGAIEPNEAHTHPDKNIITQCLGSQELDEVTVDTLTKSWQDNQWIILCSDGLSDELETSEMSRIIKQCTDVKSVTRELIQAALRAGGRDNITVQAIAAPTTKPGVFSALSQWVPIFTHNRTLDKLIFGTAFLLLLALLYWTFK